MFQNFKSKYLISPKGSYFLQIIFYELEWCLLGFYYTYLKKIEGL